MTLLGIRVFADVINMRFKSSGIREVPKSSGSILRRDRRGETQRRRWCEFSGRDWRESIYKPRRNEGPAGCWERGREWILHQKQWKEPPWDTVMSDFQTPEQREYISVIVSHSICRNLSWQPWAWMYMDAHPAPPVGWDGAWPGCSQLSALRGWWNAESGSLDERELDSPWTGAVEQEAPFPWGKPRLQTMMESPWDLVVTQYRTPLSGSIHPTPGVQKTPCHNIGNQLHSSNMHK